MSTNGEKLDTSGIERAIAGVFSSARHPTRRNLKRRMEGTPGRVYLCGGCSSRLLASKLCGGSGRHIGQIKRLAELTDTKDREKQILVVDGVLRRMIMRKELWYSDDSWFVSEEFLRRQKQLSDTRRILSRQSVVQQPFQRLA